MSGKSEAAKAVETEAEGYTGPVDFEYKGVTYTTIASGDCPELYAVMEMFQDDKVLPGLRALLEPKSYQKYRETKPKPSDAFGMLETAVEATKAKLGESAG